MIDKLLFCTHNPSKAEDVAKKLKKYSIKMESISDHGLDEVNPTETGQTFSEIAAAKFREYGRHIDDPDLIYFTDDSGLSVDALNGEPGVKSRRWKDGKTEMSDQECIDYMLERMKDVPMGKRTARFSTSIAYGRKDQKPSIAMGEIRGIILVEPRMRFAKPGYPYRAFIFVDGPDQMLSHLEEDPNFETPRDKAIRKMVEDLRASS